MTTSRRSYRRPAVLVWVILAVVLGACGEGGDEARRSEHSSALAERLFRNDAKTEAAVTDDARECVAAEFVEAIGGADALDEKGITPGELAATQDLSALDIEVGDREATMVADALEPCGVSVIDLLLVDFGDVPAEVRACVEENVDEAALRAFVVEAVVDETTEGVDPAVVDSMLVCFPG